MVNSKWLVVRETVPLLTSDNGNEGTKADTVFLPKFDVSEEVVFLGK